MVYAYWEAASYYIEQRNNCIGMLYVYDGVTYQSLTSNADLQMR